MLCFALIVCVCCLFIVDVVLFGCGAFVLFCSTSLPEANVLGILEKHQQTRRIIKLANSNSDLGDAGAPVVIQRRSPKKNIC